MLDRYKTNNYFFYYVNSWNDLFQENAFDEIYDLVFVDQSPWEARTLTMERLKNKTKLFILHDYDYFNKGILGDPNIINEGSFYYKNFTDDFYIEAYHEILPGTLILRSKNLK